MGLLILESIPDRSIFGTNALIAFRKACLESIKVDRDHAAFYRLIADHTERLIDSYHQVPLNSSIVDADFENFQVLVTAAVKAVEQTVEQRIEALNWMAAADFF